MGTEHEEARVKLGVDASGVSRDLDSITKQFKNFGNNITRSLGNVLKVNIASMIGGNIADLWGKATSAIYGQFFDLDRLEGVGKGLAKWADKLRNIREEVETIGKAIKTSEFEKLFDESDASTQRSLLEDKIKAVSGAIKAAEYDVKKFKFLATNAGELGRGDWAQDYQMQGSKAKLEAIKQTKDLLDWQKKLREFEKQFATDADKENDQRKQNLRDLVRKIKQQGDAEKKVADARKEFNRATADRARAFKGLSETSLGDAESIVGFNDKQLPGLKFNRRQIRDIRRAQLLQRWAQQQQIWGNPARAEKLTKERLDILKRNPWITDSDRDPMRLAKEHLETAAETLQELKNGLTIKAVKE